MSISGVSSSSYQNYSYGQQMTDLTNEESSGQAQIEQDEDKSITQDACNEINQSNSQLNATIKENMDKMGDSDGETKESQ